jgi:hypothetical protein
MRQRFSVFSPRRLTCAQLEEIERLVKEMGLDKADFAVLTRDDKLNGLSSTPETEARVLFTTHNMIRSRCGGRGRVNAQAGLQHACSCIVKLSLDQLVQWLGVSPVFALAVLSNRLGPEFLQGILGGFEQSVEVLHLVIQRDADVLNGIGQQVAPSASDDPPACSFRFLARGCDRGRSFWERRRGQHIWGRKDRWRLMRGG